MKELILNFHGVGEPPDGIISTELKYWWEKGPFLSVLDDIAAAARRTSCPTLITFDDGNMSDVTVAVPALIERGLKASFFICAGRIGMRDYLDAAAIRDIQQAGMAIGSHGMHHVDWRRISDADLDDEITNAKHILEKACAREISEVGIPFGSYDRRVIKKLRKGHWRHVYTSDGGLSKCGNWLKSRNTLVHGHSDQDIFSELKQRDVFTSRMKRILSIYYKQLR